MYRHDSSPSDLLPLYGVAMVRRLLKIIGLFCRISSLYRPLLQKRPIILSILRTKATLYPRYPTEHTHMNARDTSAT